MVVVLLDCLRGVVVVEEEVEEVSRRKGTIRRQRASRRRQRSKWAWWKNVGYASRAGSFGGKSLGIARVRARCRRGMPAATARPKSRRRRGAAAIRRRSGRARGDPSRGEVGRVVEERERRRGKGGSEVSSVGFVVRTTRSYSAALAKAVQSAREWKGRSRRHLRR